MIEKYSLEGNTGERRRPIGRLHDHADVERIAGPVHAAIRKEIRGEFVGLERIRHPADVEPREIELPIIAIHRKEREILPPVDGVQHRRSLPLEGLEAREPHVTLGIGFSRERREAVLADDIHGDTGQGQTCAQ